jgi:hypothetical protein
MPNTKESGRASDDLRELRVRERDGETVWQLNCPACGKWGDLDDDQLRGRVSVQHEECGFHETRDYLIDSRKRLELEAGMF